MSRGERLREGFSRFGERLAEPRWLAALFVVIVLIAAGVAYAILSGSDDDASGKDSKQAAAKIKPGEVEVAVFNGTAVAGLAATFGDKVEGKGFDLGAIGNTSEPMDTSVVMFTRGHKPEARKVGKQLGISDLELMSDEVESASKGANVAVIVGEDDAAEAG